MAHKRKGKEAKKVRQQKALERNIMHYRSLVKYSDRGQQVRFLSKHPDVAKHLESETE